MNLILLFPEDMIDSARARLTGRRQKHVREVHRASVGDLLTVGMLNGGIGTGKVNALTDDVLELEVSFDRQPPAPLPVTVVLALPRPKVLRRVLYSLAVLGVKKIVLIHAYRVEKSYWQTPFLSDDEVGRQLVHGLEQARDTVMPEVVLRKRFKPFIEDELPGMVRDQLSLLSHPYADRPFPRGSAGPAVLAVGPEGGFLAYEVEKFREIGFTAVSLGDRILNVETAVPSLIQALR